VEEQFIHFPGRAEMELDPEALKLTDHEGSALVGTEFIGWLAPNREHELSIVGLRHNNSHNSMEAVGAVTALTEGGIRAIAAGKTSKDDVFDERLERSGQTLNASFAASGK
jgi:hypothetical protein